MVASWSTWLPNTDRGEVEVEEGRSSRGSKEVEGEGGRSSRGSREEPVR